MFTWLQTNMQKHFRFLFIILLVVIVVAFVFTIGNQGPLSGSNDDRLSKLVFFETELNSESKRQEFQNVAQLSAMLSGNMRPSSQYPFERATALHIANLHNLPGPSDAQFEEFLKSRPIFQGPNGSFDPQAYTMIVDNLKLGARATEGDLRRVLEEDYRIEKVHELLAGPGFVRESEILDTLSQRLSRWSALVANIDLDSYTPELEITDEQLRAHYEEFDFQYATPVRRSVEYVELQAERFVGEVNPTEDQLIAYFEEHLDRYQPEVPEAEEGAETPEPVTFEEARPAVRNDYRLEAAREIAMDRAHDLVVKIIEQDLDADSEGLAATLAEMNLERKRTSPFAENETPIGTTWGRDVVEQAFELTPERYFSEPIETGNRIVVLFFEDQIESIIPEFETIRSRVEADVRAEQLRKARAEYAMELQNKLEAASASEESFGAAAEEAGLTVAAYRDFSLMEPAEEMDRQLLSTIAEMDAQEVSDLVRTGPENQGAFVYTISKTLPEVDENDEQYAQVASSLKSAYARFSAQQYITQMMEAEQIRIGIASPTVN